jgi:hypothetical protein
MVNESLYMKNRDLNVYSLSKINGDHQHNKDSRTTWQERNTQMTLSCIHGALSIQDLMHTPKSLSIGEVHGTVCLKQNEVIRKQHDRIL